VNLEFDILAKYVARQHVNSGSGRKGSGAINENWLKEHGF
jgi:hypothetical protein